MSIATVLIWKSLQEIIHLSVVMNQLIYPIIVYIIFPAMDGITFGGFSAGKPYCETFTRPDIKCRLNCTGGIMDKFISIPLCTTSLFVKWDIFHACACDTAVQTIAQYLFLCNLIFLGDSIVRQFYFNQVDNAPPGTEEQ